MSRFKELHKIFILLSLPLVLWLFYNQAAYRHYHVMSNGNIIEHAHPFNSNTLPGTPFQNHNHTENELYLLSQINNILVVLVLIIVTGAVFANKKIPLYPIARWPLISSDYSFINPLRGPPVY